MIALDSCINGCANRTVTLAEYKPRLPSKIVENQELQEITSGQQDLRQGACAELYSQAQMWCN